MLFERKIRVVPNNANWYLCSQAETYLQRAISHHKVVLVDNTFLVKLRGRLSGLAIRGRRAQGEETEITPGTWYSPQSQSLQDRIQSAAKNGETRVRSRRIDGGWVRIREAEESRNVFTQGSLSPEALLAQAQNAADKLPRKR
ncbi:MAG: hypothetical protein KGJ07_06810 [Patescibacteria group bacterium]|nr:hypothetical protein [Patescibacteria group bacterium]